MSLKKLSLARRGYKSFEDWNSDPNHVYIGRNKGSKWGNPFKVTNKNSVKKCLERYEDLIRGTPDLFNAVLELEGKELGCWCKPYPCHGDILIKLFKERQVSNQCYLNSENHEFTSVGLSYCGRNGDNDVSVESLVTGEKLSTPKQTEIIHLGLSKESKNNDSFKITPSSFPCQTNEDLTDKMHMMPSRKSK